MSERVKSVLDKLHDLHSALPLAVFSSGVAAGQRLEEQVDSLGNVLLAKKALDCISGGATMEGGHHAAATRTAVPHDWDNVWVNFVNKPSLWKEISKSGDGDGAGWQPQVS
jgi:hypothetical protein